MKLSQFKFKLPEDKIALHPMKYRDESRLMVLHRNTGKIEHKMFKDVLDYFDDKDVFIFNDTKVFPAPSFFAKIDWKRSASSGSTGRLMIEWGSGVSPKEYKAFLNSS